MRRAVILSSMLLTVTAVAAAQTAPRPGVALVLEVSGGPIAGIEPYHELPADTTLTIPAGVRVVFQHYASCRRFVVSGGVAKIRADGVDLSGNVQPASTRVPCPRKILLKDGGTSAAAVMRNVTPASLPTEVALRPQFVVVGARADEIIGLRIRRGSEIVVEHAFSAERRFLWPRDAAPLVAGAFYELELLVAGSERASVAVGLHATASPAAGETVTLLSAE